MLKGILFDLDGTLVDSLSATLEAFNLSIVSQGGKSRTASEILKYFGPGEGRIFERILKEDGISGEKAQVAYELCRDHLNQNMGKLPLHIGVPELLEKIKSAGVPVSIVTGRGWETTEMILKHHRILDRFTKVIANDHVGSPKPSPEGIQIALKEMRLEPADAIYVGDSWVDIRAAHSAGCQGVAALWDLMVDRELLEEHKPHHWAEKSEQIWEIYNG